MLYKFIKIKRHSSTNGKRLSG